MARAGPDIHGRGGGNVSISHARGSDSVMMMEAVMMTEIPVMVMVAVMMAAPSGVGIQHVRVHVDAPELRLVHGSAIATRHRRRGKNGSCEQRGGNCLQHRRFLWDRGVTGRMAGSSIMLANLPAAR